MVKPGKIDWLALETKVRDALRSVTLANGAVTDSAEDLLNALHLIDDAVAQETGRGWCLPCRPEGGYHE